MDEPNENPAPAAETDGNQEKEREPVKLIPEGYVADNTLPSLSLEDFEDDDEVWLIDIPVTVDPKKLFGQQLDFRHETSFIIDEQANERCISMPSSEPCSAICLLSSHHDNSKKIVALNPAGKISININYDLPECGTMIPESSSVQLPVGLKVRHPFLGSGYKGIVKLMEGINEKSGGGKDDISPIKQLNQNNSLADEYISTDLRSEEEGESVNVMTIKSEQFSPKKSKKRKRESLYEDGNDEIVRQFGVDPCHLPKKHKKEKKEEANVQELVENEIPNETMTIKVEVVSPKKRKKDKKRESEIMGGVNAVAMLEEVDDSLNTSLQTNKKKIKKEKKEPHWSGDGEGVTDVSQVKSPKKAKKRKKIDSEHLSEAEESDVLQKNILMIREVTAQALVRMKDGKSEFMEEQNDSVLDTSYKEKDDNIQEIALNESIIKKEKSKKKHSVADVDIEAAALDPHAVHLKAKCEMKEPVEKEMPSERIEVLPIEDGHMKRKKKKEKKRESEIVQIELDSEALKEENYVISGTPRQMPKKKKIKVEHGYSVTEGVGDVSLVEPTEENYGKIKKKKRDSDNGGELGQGDTLSKDVMIVAETPDQRLGRAKKIKKELKRESGITLLEVSCEGDGDAEPRKSKKNSIMVKEHMAAVYDYQDSPLIVGSKGTVEMESFSEGVLPEEGGEIKKKRKKDKKRESEIVNIELDGEASEVYVIPDTPEQIPKKKKKKIKVEPECGVEEDVGNVSLVRPSLPDEIGEETPKKSKKKKKRDSEYGGGSGQSVVWTDDVVQVDPMPAQTSEVIVRPKKDKWYIDRQPSIGEPYKSDRSPFHGKKVKKVSAETVLDEHQQGENISVNKIFSNGSKKEKRRHTMDYTGTSAVDIDPNRINLVSGMKMEGKSQRKERYSLMTQGFGAQLLTPKKEKKIKKESIG